MIQKLFRVGAVFLLVASQFLGGAFAADVAGKYLSGDPFDPVAVLKDGPLKGDTIDTTTKRKIIIIGDYRAYKALGISSSKYILVANLSHFKDPSKAFEEYSDSDAIAANTEHYIAAIPRSAVEALSYEKTMFFTKDETAQEAASTYDDELLAHLQFKFVFREGAGILLLVPQSRLDKSLQLPRYRPSSLSEEAWQRVASQRLGATLEILELMISFEATFVREKNLDFFSGGLILRDAYATMLRVMSYPLRYAEVKMQHGGDIDHGKTTVPMHVPPQVRLSKNVFFSNLLIAFLNESDSRDVNDRRYNPFTWSCHTLPFEVIDNVLRGIDGRLVPTKEEQLGYYYANHGEKISVLRANLLSHLESASEKGMLEPIAVQLSERLKVPVSVERLESAIVLLKKNEGNVDFWGQRSPVVDFLVTSPFVESLPAFLEENLELRGLLPSKH